MKVSQWLKTLSFGNFQIHFTLNILTVCLLVFLKEFDPLTVNVPLYFDDSNFTKSYTSPWVFFKFSKLYKWYLIAQPITIATKCSRMNQVKFVEGSL